MGEKPDTLDVSLDVPRFWMLILILVDAMNTV